ncbi:MAG: hypothetical protein ACD_76C00099G0004 [uncultured bacterium]|nr:MAG: hypothetical protein ACD_76C00099G0004 [uncultured bacterium]HBD05696.1 undecaprenyl-diphosphatase UppP [Candidatus Uhrbacteria bacterium]
MTIIQSIILGLVQGITEFLPISSSGHLLLLPKLFNWPESGLVFDVAMHLATLLAVVWVFRSDLLEIIKGKNIRLAKLMVVASVPIAIIGFFIKDLVDIVRNSQTAIAMLIVFGLVLMFADMYSRKSNAQTDKNNVSYARALVIGLAQVISLIPGVSRSGATISAGLFAGLDRVNAAKFSFLISIPAIFGAGLVTVFDVFQSGESIEWVPIFAGFVSALVFGSIAINLLLKFVQKNSYSVFVWYRIAFAVISALIIYA